MFVSIKVRFLEAFWESEAPRIGETGARGWAGWLREAADKLNEPPVLTDEEEERQVMIAKIEELNAQAEAAGDAGDVAKAMGLMEQANALGEQLVEKREMATSESAFSSFVESNQGGAAAAPGEELGEMRGEEEWDESDEEPEDEDEEEAARKQKTPELEKAAANAAVEGAALEADDKRLLVQWFKEEEELGQSRWRPRGSSDDALDEADPDMVVLFEDVSDIICSYSDKKVRAQLASALLSFLGAPLPVAFNADAELFSEVADDASMFEVADCLDSLLLQTAFTGCEPGGAPCLRTFQQQHAEPLGSFSVKHGGWFSRCSERSPRR